jgi:uncharacterized protein (DUF1697 family)
MALVVFLRGVNVGGHRTFRPSILARELSGYDVLNVGAAGTFVVRKPGSRAKFRTALLRKLPFEAKIVLCEGRDLMRLEIENPFGSQPSPPGSSLRRLLSTDHSFEWPPLGAHSKSGKKNCECARPCQIVKVNPPSGVRVVPVM